MLNLSPLLDPTTVAVIGAADDTTILRGRILRVMLSHAFQGRIYPVSRSLAEVQGRKAYASIESVPERVDLAVLIIPSEFVPEELERCGRAGVKAALIITSGFAEQSDGQGAGLQTRVREIAARFQMIVCGPNTEGFANMAALLCPTFSPAVDRLDVPLVPNGRTGGYVAVIAQSGGMGFSFFDRGRPKELPFSYIVTTGNEACLEVFDVVDYLLDEGRTDVFLLFVENIKTAATFKRAADKALRAGKPIIVVKVGRSDAGRRAAASHTAALAGAYEMYSAMFRHYGILEGSDIEEMVDFAAAFSLYKDRLPAGRNVGIGTASGGGGGWLADACVADGLSVPELDADTRALIDKHLPAYGTSQNPVDGTAQAIREIGYSELARLIALSDRVDAVAMVVSARSAETLEREHKNLIRVAADGRKPIFMWSYTNPCAESIRILSESGYPLFTNMRHCARAIAALADYRLIRERYLDSEPVDTKDDQRRERVRSLFKERILCQHDVAQVLREYGIAALQSSLVQSEDEAADAATQLSGAVALKVQSPDILHKTDVGAVALNVSGAEAARHAYRQIVASAMQHVPHARVRGVLLERMAPKGIEMIVGIRRDALFGPMLMLGFGGVEVEVLRDVAFAPVPIDGRTASALLQKLARAPLLKGTRGATPFDVAALIGLIVRISQFAAEHADTIEELELNPVIVHARGQGVSIADGLLIQSAA